MTQNQFNRKITNWDNIIILLSAIGLMVCIAILFPQVRQMIMDFAEQISHKEFSLHQAWLQALLSYAMGGICFILFFDYCTLTGSGRALVQKVKQEIKDCLAEIDFRYFLKPVIVMFAVYLLGILTIIRANFLYMDDIGHAVTGVRGWYNWSRYIMEFFSIFVHADYNVTDISPVPQLLAILSLSFSSVLLIYIVGNKKITVVRLLASIPVGLSPYILECIVFKFESPYLASSVLASIIPFLFVARKRAFLFCSVISLLIMCMTYQAASGIYPIIVVILCFLDWNTRKKTNKEILSFLAISALAYCFAILFYRFFLMRSYNVYVSTAMHPLSHIILGTLSNIKNYAMTINSDLGLIWKVGTVLVLFFFIVKSTHQSMRKKIYSFFVSVLIVGISFILSFGVYSLLEIPLFAPRALLGFGAFLAILCIYVVSNYKKIAIVTVLALNWCLFVFAFSYGNALADQARYAEFRIGILLHDLSALYPNRSKDTMMMVQLKNSIDYAPSIKNIAKHYPIIEKMVPKRLGATGNDWDYDYFLSHFNYNSIKTEYNYSAIDFSTLNLPVVLDSYYHTIQSDGDRILIVLKH